VNYASRLWKLFTTQHIETPKRDQHILNSTHQENRLAVVPLNTRRDTRPPQIEPLSLIRYFAMWNDRRADWSMDVILYTRKGCHLCDDAMTILTHHGLDPVIVDIDADPELRDKFNTCVPVVEIDGKVRFRGNIDPMLLRRLLPHG
jgi:glutaredoxin